MPSSRRSFFTALAKISVLQTAFSKAMAFAGTSGKDQTPKAFPVTLSVRFYFPQNKKAEQFTADSQKWTDTAKFRQIFTEFQNRGELSPVLESTTYPEYVESKLFFRDHASFQRYEQELKRQQVINSRVQIELGYKVVSRLT